jgi:hypothetical protein
MIRRIWTGLALLYSNIIHKPGMSLVRGKFTLSSIWTRNELKLEEREFGSSHCLFFLLPIKLEQRLYLMLIVYPHFDCKIL